MRISKRTIFISFIITLFFLLLFTKELPYYIYKPGHADSLDEMVEVDHGYKGEGDLHLVTVSGAQATPIQYILAKALAYHDIIPIEDARPEGISDEEYMRHQLHLMENSQQASMVVAYRAADEDVMIKHNGIYVIAVIEDMPADGVIQQIGRAHV